MTKGEMEVKIRALESQVEVLQLELTTLNGALDRQSQLLLEVDVLEEKVCRSCFVTFTGTLDQQWCSDDCRYFKRARPFEEYYAMLHPKMLQARGTEPDRALAARA